MPSTAEGRGGTLEPPWRRVLIELGASELTSVFDEGARELLKETGLRRARLFPNTTEVLQPRDRNAICKIFRDAFGGEVAHNDAGALHDAARALKEQLASD